MIKRIGVIASVVSAACTIIGFCQSIQNPTSECDENHNKIKEG